MSIKRNEAHRALVADVGGTNVRYGMVNPNGNIDHIQIVSTADFPSLEAATSHYLAALGSDGQGVRRAAIGIANPVVGDQITMTNHDWTFRSNACGSRWGGTSS